RIIRNMIFFLNNKTTTTASYTLSLHDALPILWENTFQADLGLDLSFLKERLTFTADVYEKSTYDLLLYADLPPSLGYRRTYKNIDRKSTRLNSSHVKISYAVFCLKKTNKNQKK